MTLRPGFFPNLALLCVFNFVSQQRVEFKGRPQTSSNFVVVLNFKQRALLQLTRNYECLVENFSAINFEQLLSNFALLVIPLATLPEKV